LRNRTGKAAVAIKEKDRAAEIHAEKVAAAKATAPAAPAAPAAEPAKA
jgi:large subunit ribosomal protein L19